MEFFFFSEADAVQGMENSVRLHPITQGRWVQKERKIVNTDIKLGM